MQLIFVQQDSKLFLKLRKLPIKYSQFNVSQNLVSVLDIDTIWVYIAIAHLEIGPFIT